MQSATERDKYVRILNENIMPYQLHNFDSYPATQISQFGVPYDVSSIMHYGSYDFSKNGEPTILTRVRCQHLLIYLK
jgi:hypothetical protein